MFKTTNQIYQLRPSTGICDCSPATREWIRKRAPHGSKIGQLPFPVWRLKARRRMFHGKSRAEVIAQAAAAGIEVVE